MSKTKKVDSAKKDMDRGTLWEPKSLFFRVECGEADDENGNHYKLTISATHSTPIITNTKTGVHFTMSWNNIIRLAKESGIDDANVFKEMLA